MTGVLLGILCLLFITVMIFFSKSILADVVLLAFFSFIVATLYVLMYAPDVAITEAAVNAALGTIFTLAALLLCKDGHIISERQNTVFAVMVVCFTLMMMLSVVSYFPVVGALSSAVNSEVSNYYIVSVIPKLGFTNIVTGILASFRGFDTFIETIVIFIAANATYMLIGADAAEEG